MDSFGILKSSLRKGRQVLDHSPSPVFLWTDSMSYVLWIWSICPCGAHLVTESFVVKSTSQLDIDLLTGSHVVWIDWSKGFRGFNSIVHWRFQGKKRWEQMTEGFHPNYKRQEMGIPVPDLMGGFLWLQLLRLTISLHCLKGKQKSGRKVCTSPLNDSRSRKTPPWMFWWWRVGMVGKGQKVDCDRCVFQCVSENSSL